VCSCAAALLCAHACAAALVGGAAALAVFAVASVGALQFEQAGEQLAQIEQEKKELEVYLHALNEDAMGRLEFMNEAEKQKAHKAKEKDKMLKRLEKLADDAAAAEQSRQAYEEVYQTAMAVRCWPTTHPSGPFPNGVWPQMPYNPSKVCMLALMR
jgi:hypothetical protein